jgi:hypothetical protein
MAAIDPLTAGGVLLATAATDAVYVMFTSAVVARAARRKDGVLRRYAPRNDVEFRIHLRPRGAKRPRR